VLEIAEGEGGIVVSGVEIPLWGGWGWIREGGRFDSVWWKTVCRVREGVGNWFEDNIRKVVGDGRDTLFWYDRLIGDVPLRVKFPRLFELSVEKECTVENMWRLGWEPDGGAWGWRSRLFAREEESVRECAALLNNIVLQDSVHDSWRWLLDLVCGYSVRGAYHHITSSGERMDKTLVVDD